MKQQAQSQRTRYQRKRSKNTDQLVPSFLAKTYEIVQKPEYNNIIQWNAEGNGFIVKNVTQFTEKILPKYFKHNNYSSFVRQLNMYQIHKAKSSSSNTQIFSNPNFLKNNKDALKKIKRKKTKVQRSAEQHDVVRLDIIPQQSNQLLLNQITHLKNKQQQLEKVVDVLAQQNKQILQDNKRLWKRMKRTMEKQEKKFQNILFLLLLKNGGHTGEDIMTDKQIQQGNHQTYNALLPVEEPKRQNIMDALMNRFHAHQKANYKDQLFLQNNGEHMKLLNNIMGQINHNKDDNRSILQLQNQPIPLGSSSVLHEPISPLNAPLQDSYVFSPIPNTIPNLELDDMHNLSLQKGISGQFPPFSDGMGEDVAQFQSDFGEQSDK